MEVAETSDCPTNRERIIAMMEIDRSTRLGSVEIKLNQLAAAIAHLHNAYSLARKLNDDVTERACAFNLGSAYITFKNPEKGLEFLQRAVPPLSRRDGISNGDLYQNFALGYEMLSNDVEMARYFQLALNEYRRENLGPELEIAISVKLAKACSRCGDHEKAAQVYGRLAELYENISDQNGRVEALLLRSKELRATGGAEYVESLEKCLQTCDVVTDSSVSGKLLEDLGLAFTQLKCYDKAIVCFEKELVITQKSAALREREAITLQNLGAVHNSIGAFDKGIQFLESATRIFGELAKRRNQGHCFVNLGYAYARLGDTERAGEAYSHALLAARDTRDKKAEWQAAEGLAAVAFLKGQVDRAVEYYRQALGALTGVEADTKSQERIVAKLTDALQYKVSSSALPSGRSSRATPRSAVGGARNELSEPIALPLTGPLAPQTQGDLPLNVDDQNTPAVQEEPIVPDTAGEEQNYAIPSTSRDETPPPEVEPADRKRKESDVIVRVNSLKRNISEEIRKAPVRTRKRDGSEDVTYKRALGIGEYDTDSDHSLSDQRKSSVDDRLSDEMDGMLQKYRDKQSDYRKNRPGTARNDRRTNPSADGEFETESGTETETESSADEGTSTGVRQGAYRRDPSHEPDESARHTLNRDDSWEWKNHAAQFLVTGSGTNSGTADDNKYKSRSDKPSTADEARKRAISENVERRPIGSNLDRRPIGHAPSNTNNNNRQTAGTHQTTGQAAENEKENDEVKSKPEDAGRLSVDSEGITTPKTTPRHVSAVMKLRGSINEDSASEAEEHVYAEIDTKASKEFPKPPVDPLQSTYENPGNFFQPDKSTLVKEESEISSSTQYSSDSEDANEEDEEAGYASVRDPLPSPSMVFPAPARTPRDDLSYTGPQEPPPAPPAPPADDRPKMTESERDEFVRAYRERRDELERSDQLVLEEETSGRRAHKSSFCVVQ